MAGYSGYELSEMKSAENYAISRRRDMADRIQKVRDMGWFKRFLDSKVPNNKKAFYHFFSLKVSNKDELEKEIAQYESAYAAFEEAITMAQKNEEGAEDALEVAFGRLMELSNDAERKINSDSSKSMCSVHQDAVGNRYAAECSYRRVEGAMTRRQLRNTRNELQLAVSEIRSMKEESRQLRDENADLVDRLEKLQVANNQMREEQQEMKHEVALTRNLLQQFLEEIRGQ